MVHLRKSVLSVGTHRSPDGVVNVTPQRLQHFANVFGRMKDKGLTVPVDWDHATDVSKAVPLSMGDYRKQRSAKNTVGKLDHVALSPDGQSLSITLDVEDKAAAEKAAAAAEAAGAWAKAPAANRPAIRAANSLFMTFPLRI